MPDPASFARDPQYDAYWRCQKCNYFDNFSSMPKSKVDWVALKCPQCGADMVPIGWL